MLYIKIEIVYESKKITIMRLISFNINGIQSMTNKLKNGEKKGGPTNNVLISLIEEQQPDILCFQELKTQNVGHLGFLRTHFPNIYTNLSKHKKGYSGVALLAKEAPEWIDSTFNRYPEEVIGNHTDHEFDQEGRMLVAKFQSKIVITVYTPNSQNELARLQERIAWERVLRMYMIELQKEFDLPVILCGDLNCAPQEIDLSRPKSNRRSPGFSDEERSEFKNLIDSGWIDSFRELHPDQIEYTYFSNFANSRARNVGWRIDHILVHNRFRDQIRTVRILNTYFGSDHVPIQIDIE
jgi:exodeoxyribonuclease III